MIIGSVIQECLQPLSQLLTSANLTAESIDKVLFGLYMLEYSKRKCDKNHNGPRYNAAIVFVQVILCGGSTKVPLLQRKIRDYFSTADVMCSIPPDEVIAMGASKQVRVGTTAKLD